MSHRRPTPALREQIFQALEILRIPLPAEEFDQLLAPADREHLSHLEFLQRVLSPRANRRRERSVQRRLQQAQFRDPGTLETFDWQFNARTLPRQPSRIWPPASSCAAARTWPSWAKAAWARAS